jgi:hypothetical protein
MADKLLGVRSRDYFNQLSYTMLQPVIAEFSLHIPTVQVNGETQLEFRSEPNQWFLIPSSSTMTACARP